MRKNNKTNMRHPVSPGFLRSVKPAPIIGMPSRSPRKELQLAVPQIASFTREHVRRNSALTAPKITPVFRSITPIVRIGVKPTHAGATHRTIYWEHPKTRIFLLSIILNKATDRDAGPTDKKGFPDGAYC
jgi:hypothetical protein